MDNAKHTYEAMFVLEAGQSDFESAGEPIRNLLTRYEADVLALKPWDERKLAYPIRGRKRGLYAIAYFKVDPSHVAEIEHDAQLEENILRVLILQKPKLTEEEIAAETLATLSAKRSSEDRSSRRAKKDKGEGGDEDKEKSEEKGGEKGQSEKKKEEKPQKRRSDDSGDSGDSGSDEDTGDSDDDSDDSEDDQD